MTMPAASSAVMPVERRRESGVRTKLSVSPASRVSSVSPQHTMGVMPAGKQRLDLLVDGLVGLAEHLATLGVADDAVVAADVGEHAARRPRP